MITKLCTRLLPLILAATYLGCAPSTQKHAGPVFAATVPPVGMILSELTRGRAEVVTLLGGGSSPHTYEPRPSDARNVADAQALFYVADSLDGWAAKLPASRRIALIDLVPEGRLLGGEADEAVHTGSGGHDHEHGDHDPHIWSDPTLIKALIPRLVDALGACDPEGRAVYDRNAAEFTQKLDALDGELQTKLAPLKDRPVVLFHLSLQYFLKHYGLKLAAVVEPSPGKEATPRYIEQVVGVVKASGVHAVFSEPQLPKRPAEAVAEAAGVALAELDPYGGLPGRETYDALLRYNADALLKALE